MAIKSSLFVASVASLTLAMTTIGATINLLQQMKILPSSGTFSSCNCTRHDYNHEENCTSSCGWRTKSWWAKIPSWPWWPKTKSGDFEGSCRSSRSKLKLRSGLRMMTQKKNKVMRRRRTRTERMKMTRTWSCFILRLQGYVLWRRRAAAAHLHLWHDSATIAKYNKWQIFFSNIITFAQVFVWGALAVLGLRERPNLAQNLVTHRHW